MTWLQALRVITCGISLAAFTGSQAEEVRSNVFGDPFEQLTHALSDCPTPLGPAWSAGEVADAAHGRAQRGVSCYLAGRCRLANSYLYDNEIIPRVKIAVEAEGSFAGTSVWVWGQRRWVWLMGCVNSEEESRRLRELVGRIDDVEGVVNQLMIGTKSNPEYEVRRQ